MKKTKALTLSICAAGAALHIILEMFVTIRIGNDLKITLAALPFIIIALMYGPLEGFACGLAGTFLSQLLTFGLTVTTPLWIIPYAVQGLLCGLIYRTGFKRQLRLVSIGVSVFVSGLASVILTWIASYVDGVLVFKYLIVEALIAIIPVRLLVWIGISLIYTFVSFGVLRALKKNTI